ncbi:FBP domain-containing protein [Streptomyces physcomitrii]|uniref:FBP domain-containing protein n=1 Tax=Streptomyces physcomitrii TaxID=2724184 RepID=UPI0033C108C3
MRPLTEKEIRASFVNCTKGEATRMTLPRDLAEQPWEDLDFLGWRDPAAPERCCLVAEREGRLTGVMLRYPARARGQHRRSMCTLCLTTHPTGGVSLMTAAKAGKAGREGNSAGLYICTDLACSLYLRGKKTPAAGGERFEESLSLEEQIRRTMTNLSAFLDRLTA